MDEFERCKKFIKINHEFSDHGVLDLFLLQNKEAADYLPIMIDDIIKETDTYRKPIVIKNKEEANDFLVMIRDKSCNTEEKKRLKDNPYHIIIQLFNENKNILIEEKNKIINDMLPIISTIRSTTKEINTRLYVIFPEPYKTKIIDWYDFQIRDHLFSDLDQGLLVEKFAKKLDNELISKTEKTHRNKI